MEKRQKLYQYVYNEIKDYIIKNNLQPGDVLPSEMEMMRMFGVSRNVLREATKALEIMGVVSSRNGVGKIINQFDSGFISSCMFLNLLGSETAIVVQSMQVRQVLEIGFARASESERRPAEGTPLGVSARSTSSHHQAAPIRAGFCVGRGTASSIIRASTYRIISMSQICPEPCAAARRQT